MIFSSKYQRNQEKVTKMLQNCFRMLLQYMGTLISSVLSTFISSVFKVVLILLFLTTKLRATQGGKAKVQPIPAAPAGVPWGRGRDAACGRGPASLRRQFAGAAGASVPWRPWLPSRLLVLILPESPVTAALEAWSLACTSDSRPSRACDRGLPGSRGSSQAAKSACALRGRIAPSGFIHGLVTRRQGRSLSSNAESPGPCFTSYSSSLSVAKGNPYQRGKLG